MKIGEIERLIELFDKSSLTRFEYETEEETLKLSKKKEYPAPAPVVVGGSVMPVPSPAVPAAADTALRAGSGTGESQDMAPAPENQADDPSVVEVKSTYVGTISLNDEKTGKPMIQTGSKVKKGQPICQVEAMKLYNDVPAPVSGEVLSIELDNGDIVEFGTVIARIRQE